MIQYTKSTYAKVIRIIHCVFNVMNGRSKTQVSTKAGKHCSMYPIFSEVDIEITADNDMTTAFFVSLLYIIDQQGHLSCRPGSRWAYVH